MMGHKKTSANMNFIKLLRSPKLNPRLEVMRFAIYGIALGAAFVVLKPEIMMLAGEVSCRWGATTAAVEIDDCEHPSPKLKKQSPAQNDISGAQGQ